MRDPKLTLIQRVLRGELNFERFVEVMRTDGYLIDTATPDGCGFGRVSMDSARQEDLALLFNFFYPTEELNINLSVVATDEGGQPGAFSYALFNSMRVEREEVTALLRQHNATFNC
jgi:hypothetical protein